MLSRKANDIFGIISYTNLKRHIMLQKYVVEHIRNQKDDLGWTIERISLESGVGIRTVNRIFAGQDVRYSSLVAVLKALDLTIHIEKAA